MKRKQKVYALTVKKKPFLFFTPKEEQLEWICEEDLPQIERKYDILKKEIIGRVEFFDFEYKVKNYRYIAYDDNLLYKESSILASSEKDAMLKLRGKGFYVLDIHEKDY